MKCSLWQEQFNKWMDGRLAAAETAALEGHLSACPACSREKEAMVRLKSLTSAASALPAGAKLSPQFDMKFRARLRREAEAPAALPWGRLLKPALAGAALAAGLFAVRPKLAPDRVPAAAAVTETDALLDATLAYAQLDEERSRAEARARELASDLL